MKWKSPTRASGARLGVAHGRWVGTALALALLTHGPAWSQGSAPASPGPTVTTGPAQSSDMDAELFYQLLVGEIQVRSGEPGAGYSLVLDAARQSGRAELYRRAVNIALQARSGDSALSAAQAWAGAAPALEEPHRLSLQILMALNRPKEAGEALRQLLRTTAADQRLLLLQSVPNLWSRFSDKAAGLAALREGLQDTLKDPLLTPAAWAALGRVQSAAGASAEALDSARRALQASGAGGSESAEGFGLLLALLETQPAQAEPLVLAHLALPGADTEGRLRLSYARTLLELQRSGDALAQLQSLTQSHPTLAEAWLLLGALWLQKSQWTQAGSATQRYLQLVEGRAPDHPSLRGRTQALLTMAQVAEKQRNYTQALAWLDRIENQAEWLAAQTRRASVLARQGQLPAARALLRQWPEREPADAKRKLEAEAQLLREMGQYQEAYLVYGQALERFANDGDLLYQQAMAAEKAGRPDEMEQILQRLIALEPDNAHAYNALGYSLADRNQRLPEAQALIEKALALAPQDPYIQDSLGWVEFRRGRLPQARQILEQAYRQRPDAEIAAHLGEVLWTLGERDRARTVWREGSALNPENETLMETLRRLQVSL